MTVRKPTLPDVADGVLTLTNMQFSGLFVATRQNVPRVKLEDMDTLQVVIVPATKTLTQKSRDISQRDYQIEIGLFQRIDLTPHNDAFTEDELIGLAEEILEWWVDDQGGVTVVDGADSIPVICRGGRLANDEPFDMATRRTDQVFRSIIQLDFRVV